MFEVNRFNILWKLGLVLWVAVTAPFAFARFLEEDTQEIDVEHYLNTETYNDKLSYAYPDRWSTLWQDRRLGYQVNLGSLSQTRFDLHEEIKIQTESQGTFAFAFTQLREEDLVERKFLQELRLGWRLGASSWLEIMGDGGSEKEYADLGVGVRQQWTNGFFRPYYWSVDHYYNEKRSIAEDYRSRQTYTAGLEFGLWPESSTHFWLNAAYDHPLRWHLNSRGYQYDYQKQRVDWRLQVAESGKEGWRYRGYGELKEEGKIWYVPEEWEKSLRRKIWLHEVEHFFLWGEQTSSAGFLAVWRRADYRLGDFNTAALAIHPWEPPVHPSSERREVASFFRTNWPLSGYVKQRLQGGLYANWVRIEEAKDFTELEIKLQTGWEYLISEESRVFINATWDLDQVVRDFPERKERLRPWGGGNFQAIAVF